MNPIIILDEIDKVNKNYRGVGVTSVLTALTDSSVNDKFVDEYFQFPIDLSKALIVCTFNDIYKIDRILRDRMNIIKTKPLRLVEKQVIANKYLLPKILPESGFSPKDIKISNTTVKCLIETYTCEAGVRRLKEKLSDACREASRQQILGNIQLPFTISKAFLEHMMRRKNKVIHDKIHKKPIVGVMNGMYACSSGFGRYYTYSSYQNKNR